MANPSIWNQKKVGLAAFIRVFEMGSGLVFCFFNLILFIVIFLHLGEIEHTYTSAGNYVVQLTVSDQTTSISSKMNAVVQDEIKGTKIQHINLASQCKTLSGYIGYFINEYISSIIKWDIMFQPVWTNYVWGWGNLIYTVKKPVSSAIHFYNFPYYRHISVNLSVLRQHNGCRGGNFSRHLHPEGRGDGIHSKLQRIRWGSKVGLQRWKHQTGKNCKIDWLLNNCFGRLLLLMFILK